jgi:hypothetical protein
VLDVPEVELLQQAEAERQRLVETGEIDDVGDNQPEFPPVLNDSIVGTKFEVRWRYWEPVRDPTGKDKRNKKAVDIWCEAEVVEVANGTQKESPSCRKFVDVGAVRLKWPEDKDREVPEAETYTWTMLHKDSWNDEVVLGWRFTREELRKRAEGERRAKHSRRREA